MGASSSTAARATSEQQELENLAASVGSLNDIRRCFYELSDNQTNSIPHQALQHALQLHCEYATPELDVHDKLSMALGNVGLAISDLFFSSDNETNWVEFLKGYLTCYRSMPSMEALNNLLRLFAEVVARSSVHGRGLNRFFNLVEGYSAPMLVLISADACHVNGCSSKDKRWVIGALTEQSFENHDTFYGTSGYLFAVLPVFHSFSPLGKEKNFVYSHMHVYGYVQQKKPAGIAFGGSIGNERVIVDEDFSRVIVRHHAVDKTYQPGSLYPSQGFRTVEAKISELEVWGLGGAKAKDHQLAFKKRKALFAEQRRKVDLRTFASWEDSPEKMMMNMMCDPNRVAKEDR